MRYLGLFSAVPPFSVFTGESEWPINAAEHASTASEVQRTLGFIRKNNYVIWDEFTNPPVFVQCIINQNALRHEKKRNHGSNRYSSL